MARTKFQPGQLDPFNWTPVKAVVDGMALPSDARMGPNCGLTAMAIAAGCTLAESRAAYLKHDSKRGNNWKGGTTVTNRALALHDLGVVFERITGLDGYSFLPRISLKKFCERHAAPGKRYIVTTTGHVQIVRGNVVTDQGGKININDYWGKRKIIKNILEIIE